MFSLACSALRLPPFEARYSFTPWKEEWERAVKNTIDLLHIADRCSGPTGDYNNVIDDFLTKMKSFLWAVDGELTSPKSFSNDNRYQMKRNGRRPLHYQSIAC